MADKESFKQFWLNYPRKVSRMEAMKVWERVPQAEVNDVLTGVKWYMAGEWQGRMESYIPHAATWLRAQRWKDAFLEDWEQEQPKQGRLLNFR